MALVWPLHCSFPFVFSFYRKKCKHYLLSFTFQRKACRFGTTGVNDDRIIVLMLTMPLRTFSRSRKNISKALHVDIRSIELFKMEIKGQRPLAPEGLFNAVSCCEVVRDVLAPSCNVLLKQPLYRFFLP